MNRTVRNGLAVAGMAGGMLFLGQAVASADESGDVTHSYSQNDADHPDHAKPADHHAKPVHHEQKAAAPVHHAKPAAAPVAHRTAPVSNNAQPRGELAFTGAETTAPLTLGLIALGAGGALTLAGRRRSTTAKG